ncbi:MAG: serine/threonine protein kinase [Actinobacteria bacterium]|nr:serine/threonine protein kinase [Actinomycetota bacterium]
MQQLGSRYSLDHIIGRGGTGEVWYGRDGQRQVAVKVLRRDLVDDADVVTRFVRERRLLESIRDPHVVEVIDLVAEGDTLAIVMEYVSRSDLRSYVHDQGGALAPSAAVDIARQILDALAAVHAAGVVHRDVKPENVLIGAIDDGHVTVKLSDFGVSRLVDGRTLSRVTGLIGTPRYMAPELGEGVDPSPSSDLYAVGVVLYELLTGRVPFVGEHAVAVLRAHAQEKPARPAGIPGALWKVLSSLLAKSPRQRPPDAATASARLATLQPTLAGLPVLASASLRRETTVTPGRERTYMQELHTPSTISGRVWGRVRAHSRVSVALGTALACFAGVAFMAGPRVLRSSTPAAVELAWLDQYKDFAVRRDWRLSGKHLEKFDGTEAIIVTSSAALPQYSRYLQVIPKNLAANNTLVHYAYATPQVVQRDPVFNFPLTGAEPGSYTFVRYTIAVGKATGHGNRLKSWNQELTEERQGLKDANPQIQVEVPKVTQITPQGALSGSSPVAPNQVLNALTAAGAAAGVNVPPALGPLLQVNGNNPPVSPLPSSTTPTPTDPVKVVNPPVVTTTTTTTIPTTTTTAAPTTVPPSTDTSSTTSSTPSSTDSSSTTSSTPPSTDTSTTTAGPTVTGASATTSSTTPPST